MQHLNLALGLGLGAVLLAGGASAGDAKTTTKEPMAAAAASSWTGTLVDSKCYAMDKKNVANKHGDMDKCGTACAKEGIPVGLLVGGKVHILLAPAPALADHVGAKCTVDGKMMDGGVLPDKVMCAGADGKMMEVKMSSM